MGGNGSGHPRSVALRIRDARRVATSQFGLLTKEQLEQFAVDSWGRARMVQRGHLISVHPGVWRIPDVAPSKRQKWVAACLAVEGAALSHHSAAAFYELDIPEQDVVHVAVPRRGVRGPEGVCVHCVGVLPPRSIVRAGPLRVTRIERTLLDLAGAMDDESLQTVFDSAWLKRKVDPLDLGRQLAKVGRGRYGVARLRRVVTDAVARRRPLEGRLEVMFWRAAKAKRLRPEVQVRLVDSHRPNCRLDFLFPKENLVVETMGFSSHGTEEKFESDALRLARVVASGKAVLPVTYRMMNNSPENVMRWVEEALAVRRTTVA
jgi:very-short-patch-repair endonuclease